MVGEASNAISRSAWLLVPTGGALALTVMAFVLLGDAVRDATVERGTIPPPILGRRRVGRRTTPVPEEPAPDADAILSVHGLTITLPRDGESAAVVQDVGFSIHAGETVGLVGESGCGKSITARAILGLLPAGAQVTAGSVVLDRAELTRLPERALRNIRGSGIALISQDPSAASTRRSRSAASCAR
jgi:peptide/nickel transport system permease protein